MHLWMCAVTYVQHVQHAICSMTMSMTCTECRIAQTTAVHRQTHHSAALSATMATIRDLPPPPRPQMHQTSPRGRPGHPAKAPVAAARASIAAGVADDNLLAGNSEDPRCPGVLSRHLLYHGTQTRSDTRRRSSASLLHACALDARRAAALRCAAACFTMCPNWHLKLNH